MVTRVACQGDGPDSEEGKVDIALKGPGPWELDNTHDVQVLYTPGPTSSSVSILVSLPGSQNTLFSGRTAGYDPHLGRVNGVHDERITRAVSVGEQAHSIRKLANKDFTWLASGMGHLHRFDGAAERALAMLDGADELERSSSSATKQEDQ